MTHRTSRSTAGGSGRGKSEALSKNGGSHFSKVTCDICDLPVKQGEGRWLPFNSQEEVLFTDDSGTELCSAPAKVSSTPKMRDGACAGTTIGILFVLDCTGSMARAMDQLKADIGEVRAGIVGMASRRALDAWDTSTSATRDRLRSNLSSTPTAGLTCTLSFSAYEQKVDVAMVQRMWQAHSTQPARWTGCPSSRSSSTSPTHHATAPCTTISVTRTTSPIGDPAGRDPIDQLRSLARCGIGYTFLKLTSDTDIMLQHFATAYEHSSRIFRAVDLHAAAE